MIHGRDSVLVVVDMQKGFLNAHSMHIVPNVCRLVRECQNRSIPVVFTRFANSTDSPFEKLIEWKKHYSAPETDIVAELVPFVKTIIDKNFYTAFTNRMDELVKKNEWRNIILCGIATESCVTKTAVDAFERYLRPILVSDACASDAGEEAHKAGLLVLRRFIGAKQILSTERLFEILDSKHQPTD